MKIIAVTAISLNGYITHGDEAGTTFTSEADKTWFSEAMNSFPVKVMGRKTFETSKKNILRNRDESSSNWRIVLTRSPKFYQQFNVPGCLEFSDESPQKLVQKIQAAGHHDSQIAILGGGAIYSAFLEVGLINEIWLTLEPQLFGSGTPLLQQGIKTNLRLLESSHLGPSTLLLKYSCEQ